MKARVNCNQLTLFDYKGLVTFGDIAAVDYSSVEEEIETEDNAVVKKEVSPTSVSRSVSNIYAFPRRNTVSAPTDGTSVLEVLGDHIGHRYALLLHLLGYTRITDLARAHPAALLSIAGIGQARLTRIQQVLRSRGLQLGPVRPRNSRFGVAFGQLKRELEGSR